MSLSVLAVVRAVVVTAAGAGLVVAAARVPGVVTVGPVVGATPSARASSSPVHGASVNCPGPELMGVPGVRDLPVGVKVAAATAPPAALAGTQPVGTPGTLTLTGMPGASLATPGSQRGVQVGAALTTAQGVEASATQSLAPGLAAAQSWLVGSGDQRSLGSAPCVRPAADQWLLAGGSAPGRQERLILTNPGGNPVTVDVTLYGPSGPVASSIGKSLVVPAHGRSAFLVDSISGNVASPAVHVVTQGGVVGAVVNDTWLNGTQPGGSDDASPSAPPSLDQVIPAVDVKGFAVLRVVVPGSAEAVVQARVLTRQGPRALPTGGVSRVPGGTVHDIDISRLPAGASALQVRSDQPVVASAIVARAGKQSLDFAWAVSTPPITTVAGMPFTDPAGVSHVLDLTASAGAATAEVVTVTSAGAVHSAKVVVPVDGTAPVTIPARTSSVWVVPVSGSGQLRAAVESWITDGTGTLITSTPLLDSALRTTTVGVRQVLD
jgi:hypothetical protein